jgi:hypothetical protein
MPLRPSTDAGIEPSMPRPSCLADWLEEEVLVKNRLGNGAGSGVARPDQVAGKTGLALMQAMLQGEIPRAHYRHDT